MTTSSREGGREGVEHVVVGRAIDRPGPDSHDEVAVESTTDRGPRGTGTDVDAHANTLVVHLGMVVLLG